MYVTVPILGRLFSSENPHKGEAVVSVSVGFLGIVFIALSARKQQSYNATASFQRGGGASEYTDYEGKDVEGSSVSKSGAWYVLLFLAISCVTYFLLCVLRRRGNDTYASTSYIRQQGGSCDGDKTMLSSVQEGGILDDILNNVSRDDAGF